MRIIGEDMKESLKGECPNCKTKFVCGEQDVINNEIGHGVICPRCGMLIDIEKLEENNDLPDIKA